MVNFSVKDSLEGGSCKILPKSIPDTVKITPGRSIKVFFTKFTSFGYIYLDVYTVLRN